MYHFEQRERFWDKKSDELREKLQGLGKVFRCKFNDNRNEIKSTLKEGGDFERRNKEKYSKQGDFKLKIAELQKLNQDLTHLLLAKEKELQEKSTSEIDPLKEEILIYQEKLESFNIEKNKSTDLFESRIKALNHELEEKSQILSDLNKKISSLDLALSSHSNCEVLISDLKSRIKFLEAQGPNQDIIKQVNVLEEENNLLKEQILLFQEAQKADAEKQRQKILSKEKPDFFDRGKELETENKVLAQKLAQEYSSRLEGLEKIKSLQEVLSKVAPDCGYDSELPRIKSQIAALKGQLTGTLPEQHPGSRDFYEKIVEIDILKGELRAARGENQRVKEELAQCSKAFQDLSKQGVSETCTNKDIFCFIQCEAAALEDLLEGADSQDFDSDDLY